MTLLEVMIGFALLIPIMLGFSYMALGSASLNRKTEMLVAGSNAITAQMASVVAASADNQDIAHGTAKGFVRYLRELESEVASKGADYPVKVQYYAAQGILRYDFPVAALGAITGNITTVSTTVDQRAKTAARGVMYVYLRENAVPREFYAWNNLEGVGAGERSEANDSTFFDMNADGKNDGDFSDLLTGSEGKYVSSDLSSLPISISLMYYPSQNYMAKAEANLEVLSGTLPDTGYAQMSFTRNYIINDSSVLGLDFY